MHNLIDFITVYRHPLAMLKMISDFTKKKVAQNMTASKEKNQYLFQWKENNIN